MSLATLDEIFVLRRNRFPEDLPKDFSAQSLRHTCNDNFRIAANSRGLNGAELKLVQNYVMGWSKDSEQSADYMRLSTQQEARAVMLLMQSRAAVMHG